MTGNCQVCGGGCVLCEARGIYICCGCCKNEICGPDNQTLN